jgi:hypothetical protein
MSHYHELEEHFGFDIHELALNQIDKRLSAAQRTRLRQQLPMLDRWWNRWRWAAGLLLCINIILLLVGLILGISWLVAIQVPSLVLIATWWYRVKTGLNSSWNRVLAVSGTPLKYETGHLPGERHHYTRLL